MTNRLRLRKSWFSTLSNLTWHFKGLSINMSGLNNTSITVFRRLLKQFVQETKFNSHDHLKTATYFLHFHDSKAQAIWSHDLSNNYNGRNVVGILIGGNSPFTSITTHTQTIWPTCTYLDRYLYSKHLLGNKCFTYTAYMHQ